jgi:hypothetical protein
VLRSKSLNLLAQRNVGFTKGRAHAAGHLLTSANER